jgi:DNA-binding transcriptional ArsR family regulator
MSTKRYESNLRNLHQKAPLFAALGDETRLTLISKLTVSSPLSITQLSEASEISRQAITRHLQVLEDARIVRGVRQGRENLFALERKTLIDAKQALETISEEWDQALERLKLFVEE